MKILELFDLALARVLVLYGDGKITKYHLERFAENPDKVLPDADGVIQIPGVKIKASAVYESLVVDEGRLYYVCSTEHGALPGTLYVDQEVFGIYPGKIVSYDVKNGDVVVCSRNPKDYTAFLVEWTRDGQKSVKKWDEVKYLQMTEYGPLYAGEDEGWYIVLGGREWGPYKKVTTPRLVGNILYVAVREDEKWWLKIIDLKEHENFMYPPDPDYYTDFEDIEFYGEFDGRRLWSGMIETDYYLCFGKQRLRPYTEIGESCIVKRKDGEYDLYYAARSIGKEDWHLYLNGKRLSETIFRGIADIRPAFGSGVLFVGDCSLSPDSSNPELKLWRPWKATPDEAVPLCHHEIAYDEIFFAKTPLSFLFVARLGNKWQIKSCLGLISTNKTWDQILNLRAKGGVARFYGRRGRRVYDVTIPFN